MPYTKVMVSSLASLARSELQSTIAPWATVPFHFKRYKPFNTASLLRWFMLSFPAGTEWGHGVSPSFSR